MSKSEIVTASEMIEKLQSLIKLYGDQPLVYAKDEEGNGFNYLYYEASAGQYDEDDCDWTSVQNYDGEEVEVNSFCVN